MSTTTSPPTTPTQAHAYTHTHTVLGPLTGALLHPTLPPLHSYPSTIVQFRSIPYASIPTRFAQSHLFTSLPSAVHPLSTDPRPPRTFTTYGAACPSTPQPRTPYGGSLPGEPIAHLYDEWSCLNLTIAVPKAVLEQSEVKKVPVMVYVHGGGAREGAGHVDGMHDNARLCALSVHEGMEVIVVSIRYRLNWLGFLACGDLVEEARLDGASEEEGVFNVGLYDQRRAFQWIQSNIAGFGGDPGNVTAFGESAGSICLVYHLCSEKRLFRRAVLQSGSPFGTQGIEEKDAEYERLLGVLEVEESSAKERLTMLREVNVEKLTRVQSVQSIFPYFGPGTEEMFEAGRAPDYATAARLVGECPWVEDVVVGDCQFEGYTFADFLKHVDSKKFAKHLHTVLGDTVAAKLLNAYGIAGDGNMDRNLFWANVMLLFGDLFLSEPMEALADTLAGSTYMVPASGKTEGDERRRKVYRYTLGLTNPLPGSECSYVTGHHGVDNHFQFLNLLERYPRRRHDFIARQAIEMARRWIVFAHGEEPWAEYVPPAQKGEGKIAVCDDIRGWTERTRDEDMRIGLDDPWGDRRYEGWATIRWVFDQVRAAAGNGCSAQEQVNRAHKELFNLAAYMMGKASSSSSLCPPKTCRG